MKTLFPVLACVLLAVVGCEASSETAVEETAASVDSLGNAEALDSAKPAPAETAATPATETAAAPTPDEIYMMMYGREEGAETQLRGLLQDSQKTVRGTAKFALGSLLMRKDEKSIEAQELLQSVVDDYADVSFEIRNRNVDIASKAETALFAVNNLQIGMEVPEIEGTDLDGVGFKLSDYRGKVVLLDFWGNW